MTESVAAVYTPRPCPICGKPSTAAHHPFCSGRCADVDLYRWLSNSYVVPETAIDAGTDEVDGDSGKPADDDD